MSAQGRLLPATYSIALPDTGRSRPKFFGPARGRRVVAVGTEQNELLAAVPRDQVARPARLLEKLREVLQHFVTGLVSEGVVDSFEMVDVRDDQAARQVALQMRQHKHLMHAVELGPVGHARQRILGRRLMQALAAGFERQLGGGRPCW